MCAIRLSSTFGALPRQMTAGDFAPFEYYPPTETPRLRGYPFSERIDFGQAVRAKVSLPTAGTFNRPVSQKAARRMQSDECFQCVRGDRTFSTSLTELSNDAGS